MFSNSHYPPYPFSILEHYLPSSHFFKNIYDILQLAELVCNNGNEGIVLKTLNGPYEFSRSNHWCKVKKFYTLDLPVVGWEYGKKGNKDVLGALHVELNGVRTKVGSGISKNQRREFMENLPSLVEVKYQEITKDGVLRFPVFVRVRDDK